MKYVGFTPSKATITISGKGLSQVPTYTDLPKNPQKGELVYVTTATGVPIFGKRNGIYRWNGKQWKYSHADATTFFTTLTTDIQKIIKSLPPLITQIDDTYALMEYHFTHIYWIRNLATGQEAYKTTNNNKTKEHMWNDRDTLIYEPRNTLKRT